MPCYTVRKLSVEFKAKYVDLLKDAARSLGWDWYYDEARQTIKLNYGRVTIDMKNSKAECYNQRELNQLKQAYSTKALEKVAAKKKWLLKNVGNNKMQLKRF